MSGDKKTKWRKLMGHHKWADIKHKMSPERSARIDEELAKIGGTWAYTKNEQIFVPEKKFEHLTDKQTVQPLRGYAYVVAIIENDVCVGWMRG